MITVYSYGLIIETCKKYRILLSQYTKYLHKWLVRGSFDMFTAAMFINFFSVKFLNVCKPRTILNLLWQTGAPGLAFCGSGLTHSPSLLGMIIQAGQVSCNQKFSCKWNLSFFKTFPPNRLPFYLGSPLYIITSLFSHSCLFQNTI